MMGVIANRTIFKMVRALFINEEDTAVKGFYIAGYLLGLKQFEYLDHHITPLVSGVAIVGG